MDFITSTKGTMSEATRSLPQVRLSVRTKLIGGYIVMVLLLIALFFVASNGLRAIGNSAHAAVEETKYLKQVVELKALVAEEGEFYSNYLLTHNEDALKNARAVGQEVNSIIMGIHPHFSDVHDTEAIYALNLFLTSHDQFIDNKESMVTFYTGN